MNIMEAREEYSRALKAGQKEVKELLSEGKFPYPAVLDEIIPAADIDSVVNIGMVEIPTNLIIAEFRHDSVDDAGDPGRTHIFQHADPFVALLHIEFS